MIDRDVWRKGWALLDKRERWQAWAVLGVVVLAALSSAVMIGSVLPFLSVLSDPGRIHSVPILARAYELGGFTTDYGFLVALGVASLLTILVTNLIQVAKVYIVTRFTMMRMHTFSHRLLSTYLRQPYEYFLDHHSGEMGTQILAEAGQVVGQFLEPAANLIASALTVLAIVALLLWVDPVVALVAFALFGGIYGGTFTLSRRITARLGEIRAQANKERFRLANEALGGVKDIKLLGREQTYVDRYSRPSRRMARSVVGVMVIGQVPQYLIQVVAFGGMILLCLAFLGPEEFATGAALGDILPVLGVFAFAGQRLIPELSRVYQMLTRLNYGSAAVEALHRDLVLTAPAGDLPRVQPTPLGLHRELRLEKVSYRYPNADHAGLSDISLSIRAGEKIGIVGSTGAGKTTLADLVLGLLRPTEGTLLADGVAITGENLRNWQQTVGYVPQDIFLTDSSVAENIALGIPPAAIDLDRVRKAAEIAQIDRFILEELPQAYDTLVGERGVRLSGGQRQRVGIARALYHDADLIVFDEATSALDNLTEREVMAAIDHLPGDKTVIMIAHRLSTVQKCDRIIVLKKGMLDGVGPWRRLASENEELRKMVGAQGLMKDAV